MPHSVCCFSKYHRFDFGGSVESWKTKDLYNTRDENLDKSQLIGGISKPAAMFWCLRTFFSPVGCFSGNKPRQAHGMSGLQWSAPCLRGRVFLRGVEDFPWGSCGVSEEGNWVEWNLCAGEELAMAYIGIETREVICSWGWLLEPEITFRPGESTHTAASSWRVCI